MSREFISKELDYKIDRMKYYNETIDLDWLEMIAKEFDELPFEEDHYNCVDKYDYEILEHENAELREQIESLEEALNEKEKV